MYLSLEDNYTVVLAKAMHGLQLTDIALAERTGLSLEELQAFHYGIFDPIIAYKVATALGLDPTAFQAIAEGRYTPAPVKTGGLAQFTSAYEEMTVNAYLVWDPVSRKAAVFDTGTDVTDLLHFAYLQELSIDSIFITHTHEENIFDLERLWEKTRTEVWVGERESISGASTFSEGKRWSLGGILIESRLTWGHSIGGMSYVITGLERPLAIVGDSICAGSIGAPRVSYAEAVKNTEKQILSLPPETILAPSHGPMSTVAEQLHDNPFFAHNSGGSRVLYGEAISYNS